MARRLFFVEDVHSGRAQIAGEDAQHLTRVLRVEEGQMYEVSDNSQRYLATVESVRKSLVVFRLMEKIESRPAPLRLHLMAALVKFDPFEWTLEKATELGVESITPVVAERSEKGLDRAAGKRMTRWIRLLRESSQQCRRTVMPLLQQPVDAAKALPRPGLVLLLDEAASQPILAALPERRHASDEVTLIVGPEGGWVEAERTRLMAAGCKAVSLGPTVLRAETAAIAGLAILSAAWQTTVAFSRGNPGAGAEDSP